MFPILQPEVNRTGFSFYTHFCVKIVTVGVVWKAFLKIQETNQLSNTRTFIFLSSNIKHTDTQRKVSTLEVNLFPKYKQPNILNVKDN